MKLSSALRVQIRALRRADFIRISLCPSHEIAVCPSAFAFSKSEKFVGNGRSTVL